MDKNFQLPTRIMNKYNTTKYWNELNPVLLAGEVVFEITSTNEIRMKVGDGKNVYKDLKYTTSSEDAKQIISLKNAQLDLEDELRFTQIALVVITIMNIIIASIFIYILAL